MVFSRRVFAASVWVLLSFGLLSCAHRTASLVEVQLVALNDFHGYLLPSFYDGDTDENTAGLMAGGIATLGGVLRELRAEDPQLLFIGNGDLVGASPPVSNIWADEPSIMAMNMLGMHLSSTGNHEFDEGKAELLRQIHGGCQSPRPEKACQFHAAYEGAQFHYLAANVWDEDTGERLLAPYRIEQVKGVKIAFVAAEVADLASYIAPSSMVGIRVTDEAEAINALVPELQAQGVEAIVAVVHQGGVSGGGINSCDNLSGDILSIAERLHPAVDVLLSAHTHEAYICQRGHLTITQGASYGHLLTHLRLVIDRTSGDVRHVVAKNIVVDPSRYAPDPTLQAFAEQLEARGRELLQRPIATLGARAITRTLSAAGESAMGNLVADAQLAATRALGAQFALMNTGGIRSDLILAPGQQTLVFDQVSAVHPFKGTLQVLSLSGAQLKALLEQQWRDNTPEGFRPLQVSEGLTYRWSASRALGDKILPGSLQVMGVAVTDEAQYRFAVNEFLAEGGDNFSLFTQASLRQDSTIRDLDALIDYLRAQQAQGSPAGRATPQGRVQRVGL